jgi:(1->4)-alpha-D-glucan 1-alpha-D-glucosylmutase
MNMSTATYRIQFNPALGFKNAQPVISSLADLGISDLYASHLFKAAKGSLHGYDVVDPNHLNPELGGLSDLEALAAELQAYNMTEPLCFKTKQRYYCPSPPEINFTGNKL